MTFTDANQYDDTITKNLIAGEYYGIGIDAGGVSQRQLLALKAKLTTTQANLSAQNFTGMTKDDILGSLLYTTAAAYYAEYDMMDQMQAKMMGVVIVRIPSDAIFSVSMNVSYMFGVATNISPSGLKMDVQRNLELTEALDGNISKVIQYNIQSGMNSSALEASVPEQLWSTPLHPAQGISAVKAIQIANDQDIPIYSINQSNINAVLSRLQLPSDVISDIQNAVNAGEIVTVSQTEINFNGWTGVGYIIIDPTTGAGAYMISGGVGGSWTWIIWLAAEIICIVAIALLAVLLSSGSVEAFLALMAANWVEFTALINSIYLTGATTIINFLTSNFFTNKIVPSFAACYLRTPVTGLPNANTLECMAVVITLLYLLGL
ncbi:MAG: hypothetical protein M1381_09830 [Deltaproteobacteria bacterium]|nr:hypothetical protein [Deltaproteobacteria bacterium]